MLGKVVEGLSNGSTSRSSWPVAASAALSSSSSKLCTLLTVHQVRLQRLQMRGDSRYFNRPGSTCVHLCQWSAWRPALGGPPRLEARLPPLDWWSLQDRVHPAEVHALVKVRPSKTTPQCCRRAPHTAVGRWGIGIATTDASHVCMTSL